MSIAMDQKVEDLEARVKSLETANSWLQAELTKLHQQIFDPTGRPERHEKRNGQRG